MKILIGIIIGGVLAFAFMHAHKAMTAAATTTIPNTPQAFFAAVASGQITFKTSDPFGIYDANGTKIGYWTGDGSVYDMSNNLVAKGLSGLNTQSKMVK
jgi:hypothetical protein